MKLKFAGFPFASIKLHLLSLSTNTLFLFCFVSVQSTKTVFWNIWLSMSVLQSASFYLLFFFWFISMLSSSACLYLSRRWNCWVSLELLTDSHVTSHGNTNTFSRTERPAAEAFDGKLLLWHFVVSGSLFLLYAAIFLSSKIKIHFVRTKKKLLILSEGAMFGHHFGDKIEIALKF